MRKSAIAEAARVGKRGTVVIPARIRRQFGIEEGTTVLVDAGPEGVLIRPAVTVPVEVYSPQRKAAFLLESWMKPEDYPKVREQVRRMGIDPDKIPHTRPK
jgi:AbrB family looped-hinge helix DNA binding protein